MSLQETMKKFDKELREVIYLKASSLAGECGCSSQDNNYPMVRRKIQDICDRTIEIGQSFLSQSIKTALESVVPEERLDLEGVNWKYWMDCRSEMLTNIENYLTK